MISDANETIRTPISQFFKVHLAKVLELRVRVISGVK